MYVRINLRVGLQHPSVVTLVGRKICGCRILASTLCRRVCFGELLFTQASTLQQGSLCVAKRLTTGHLYRLSPELQVAGNHLLIVK
jgi:hypothetical protein